MRLALAFLIATACSAAPAPADQAAHDNRPPPPQHAPIAQGSPPPGATQPHAQPPAPAPSPTPSPSPSPSPTPTPTPSPSSSLPPRYAAALAAHNAHRANHCAPPLTWSDDIAAASQAWADRLRDAGCAFEHNPRTRYGENLAFFAPAGQLDATAVVRGWYDEITKYDFDRPGFDFSTGHFTQVVWKNTRKMGCGVAQCGGGELWVCNYDPPGNFEGQYPQNVTRRGCK